MMEINEPILKLFNNMFCEQYEMKASLLTKYVFQKHLKRELLKRRYHKEICIKVVIGH